MNKDIARKLIATVAAERKNANEFTEKDFINVLSYKRKMVSENNIPKFIESARELFLHPPAVENIDINFKEPEREKVIQYLCDTHNFSMDRISHYLRLCNCNCIWWIVYSGRAD